MYHITLERIHAQVCVLQAPVATALAQLIHSTVDPVYHQHSGLSARLKPKDHPPRSNKAPPQVGESSLQLYSTGTVLYNIGPAQVQGSSTTQQ